MGRSFRSGHHEGFATVLEYKHTHPVVVDWIQEVSISEAENPIESISQQIEKHFPDQKNRQEQEHQIASQYKQGIIPINVLLKYYNNDWWRIFQFAAENKLNVSHGNIKQLKLEQELIGDHLVVDAQTLIAKNYGDSKAIEKAAKILYYIRTVLAGIKEIFPNDAEKWQQYTELKRIVLREVKEKT